MNKNKQTQNNHSEQQMVQWWNEARTHFAAKEYELAIEALNNLLKIDPNDINALINKGAALYFLKRYEEALQCFEVILNVQPNNANALKNKAGVLFNLSRYYEASIIYDQLLTQNKNDVSILKNKALTLIKLKKKDEAITVYEDILKTDPQNKGIAIKLADLLHEMEHYEEEMSVYNNLLVNDSENIELLNKKGIAYINLGRYNNAVEIFNKVLSLDANNKEAISYKKEAVSRWNIQREEEEFKTAEEYKYAKVENLINEGNDFFAKKEYKQAQQCFSKALEIDRKNSDAMLGEGIILALSEKHTEALNYFDRVLENDPQNIKALIHKGELQYRMKLYAEALDCFDAVLEIDPNNFKALCNREDTLVILENAYVNSEISLNENQHEIKDMTNQASVADQIQEEIEEDQQVNSESNSDLETLLSQGYNLLKANNLDKALQIFNQAARLDPKNTRVLSFLGTTYYLLKKIDKAIACYDKVLESEPYNINILCHKGNALDSLRQYDNAIIYYDRALSFAPENISILNSKALSLYKMGKNKEAAECYQKVLERNDSNTDALYQLGIIYKDADEYAAALDCFDRVLEIDPNHLDAYHLKEEIELFIEQIIEEASLPEQEERIRKSEEVKQKKETFVSLQDSPIRETNYVSPSIGTEEDPFLQQKNYVTSILQAEQTTLDEQPSDYNVASILPDENAQVELNKNTNVTLINEELEKSVEQPKYYTTPTIVEEKQINNNQPKYYTTPTLIDEQAKDIEEPKYYASKNMHEEKQAFIANTISQEEAQKQQHIVWFNNAINAYQQEDFFKAIKQLDLILRDDPYNIEALNSKGVVLYKINKYNQAIDCYDKVLDIDSRDIDALNNKGTTLYQLGHYNEAINCFNNILDINDKDADAYYNKGIALSDLNRYDEAIECYDKVLAIDKRNANALNNKGNALYQLNKYNDAIICFDKALDIDEHNIKTLNNKGNALSYLKRYDEAIECYNKVLNIDSDDISTLHNKANALYKLNRYNQAIECYNEILEKDKKDTNALHNGGVASLFAQQTLQSADFFAKINYTSLDLLSLFAPIQNEEESLFDVIQEIIEKNENDYFNTVVDKSDNLRNTYKQIYLKSLQIVKMLYVNNPIENKIAHYTSQQVVDRLFGMRRDQKPSAFRLNSISEDTDLEEGKVLFHYLNIDNCRRKIPSAYRAFVGCFSFNTESLGQFSLNNKEGTKPVGMSIVLMNDRFFRQQDDVRNSLLISAHTLLGKYIDKTEQIQNNKGNLFRCIYLDPQTNKIISLSQKEEYTMYRENKVTSDSQVTRYKEEKNILLGEIKNQFEDLNKLLKIEDLNKNIVADLLIALRYLVKHVAFNEEQECRMINIEQLHSDKVKIDDRQLFIEYIPLSNYNVDTIYFTPFTDQYKVFRDILFKKTGISAQISDYPFNFNDK